MVLPQPFTDILTTAIVITMLITPLIIMAGPHVAAGVVSIPVLTRRLGVRAASERSTGAEPLSNHVIIAGYGLTGQELAHSLKACGVHYVIVDINPGNIQRASYDREPAYFGDVTSEDVLESLGVANAVQLVLSINDLDATLRAIGAARRLAEDLQIMVRIQYAADTERMIQAGANEIVAAELEASAVMTQRVLAKCRVMEEAIAPHIERIRDRKEN